MQKPIKIGLVVASTLAVILIIAAGISGMKKNSEPVPATQNPDNSERVVLCKERTGKKDCLKCYCNSDEDCKLVGSPYVISECAEAEVVNKSTSETCLDEIRKWAMQASCVVPGNYKAPEYKAVCVNKICGKIKK